MSRFPFERTVLPAGIQEVERRADGVMYIWKPRLLAVIIAHEEHAGKRWLHLSVSHRDRIPTWEELVEVKELFLGADVEAIQVIPPRSKYVNICAKVLHLFFSDELVLPDFTRGTGSL